MQILGRWHHRIAAKYGTRSNLDELTTKDKIRRAMESQAAAVVAIKSLRVTQYGGNTAVISVPANLADLLIKRVKLRVGWSQCLIKELEPRQRCFKCLEEGHLGALCRIAIDRSQWCFRCESAVHKAAECFLCASRGSQATNHQEGTRMCSLAGKETPKTPQ